mgnify:FL=1|tara:strand:- start:3768 stop:5048 length:1281 start_codon:yes stop_codon:yes gene_type:complete
MIFLYKLFTTIFYPIFVFFIYFRKLIKKEDPIRYKEKILTSYFKVNRKDNTKLIWFHAASVGELKSIIPLINELNKKDKNFEFLVTTVTLSSSILAREELKKIKNTQHRFLPIDVNFLIEKFLKSWRPNIIFLVDSEIWPNLILNTQKLKIPISLINARFTQTSIKRWMIFPNIAKRILKVFKLFICSNKETYEFLKKLDLQNINYIGNLKLIGRIDEKKIKDINENYLLNKRFWFAASTHKNENFFCIKSHLKLKEKFEDICTIVAPRHLENVKEIKSLCNKFNLKMQILNKNEIILDDSELIIINYFGYLQNYFKYSKSVFIGKSMIKKLKDQGGQSPIEAAKLNCKIYHGPYVRNFEEIYKLLEDNKISKKINSFDELIANLIKDLENPRKLDGKISKSIDDIGQKTLNDTMRLIDNFLNAIN